MLRRTFLATVLSTTFAFAVSLSLAACGGGGSGNSNPPPPPPPTTGINVTNSATDSGAQPNTHAIARVTLSVQGGPALNQDVVIAPGATVLIALAPGTYGVNSVRYDDGVLIVVQPPAQFVLAEGDTPTYTAVRPGAQ